MKSLEARKTKSRMISFRVDEDYLARLDALALTKVARVHADLNRIGGLLEFAIREGVTDPSSYSRLNLELIDSIIQGRRAVERLAGRR